jgi:hypothetical protein
MAGGPTSILGNIGQALSGAGQTATNVLANPLVQGALATYLGAISSPRSQGLGGAIGHGGLAGLGAFGQARQAQLQLPIQRAAAQSAQLQLPVQQAAAQQAQAQMAPLSPADIQQFDQLIGAATDPEEKQFYSMIKRGYQERKLSMAEATDKIRQYNEPARLAKTMQAQAAMQGSQMMPALLRQMGIQIPTVGSSATSASATTTSAAGGGATTPVIRTDTTGRKWKVNAAGTGWEPVS